MNVLFNTTWTDTSQLAGYIFSINQSGTWINSSYITFTGTTNVSTNITKITASKGTNVTWYFTANDTFGNVNMTDVQSFVVDQSYGYLNTTLINPTSSNSQPVNQTFVLTANMSCIGDVDAICGIVNATVKYNATSSEINTTIVGNNVFTTPFYILEANPKTCGALNATMPACTLNWTINATGNIGSSYQLNVNSTSNATQVASTNSSATTISIISAGTLSITLSDALANVLFGTQLNPGSQNNSALNNTDNIYNITCSNPSGICNISIKGNDNLVSGINTLGTSNISWNLQNSLLNKFQLKQQYSVINASLPNLASQSIYFWLDVPDQTVAGNYIGNFTIQAQSS
jgi:hypothetical protein